MSIDIWSFLAVLRKPSPDPFVEVSMDYYFDDARTKGHGIIGESGTGKTEHLAGHIFDCFKRHPREAIFVLDWSGSLTDALFKLILQDKEYERLLDRVVYDDMGNPEWATPLPEFSKEYGHYEDQVQRVTQNLKRINPELARAPIIGELGISVAVNFFKLLTAIENEHGESWQITETKKLVYNEGLLKFACAKFGDHVPDAKYWLEQGYIKSPESEKTRKTTALIGTLNAIEPRAVRARLGYYRPGWTAREAIEKGQMVICDGARLINQEMTQNYLFMQAYSLIMEEINKRRPGDPRDHPVSLVLDEVYSLLRVPGMAPEIASLSPQYRSRKLQLYIVLQELEQLSRELRPHIWSLGNIVCFKLANHAEAFEVAQQFFPFDPYFIKVAPTRQGQHPMMESANEQYLEYADWINSLEHRQCLIRRYESERKMQKKIQFVRKTYETPNGELHISIENAKQILIERRGVRVRDALEVINNRKLDGTKSAKAEAPGL